MCSRVYILRKGILTLPSFKRNIFDISVFSGLVVFAILGFMAHDSGTSVETVVEGGPGLAFIVYPKVVTQMGYGASVLAALFFFMLITVSLGAVFGAFETVLSGLTDQFVQLRPYKPHLVAMVSLAMFVMGLTFTCGGGIHMFTLFNQSAPSWNLFVLTLLEVTTASWLYGADKLLRVRIFKSRAYFLLVVY